MNGYQLSCGHWQSDERGYEIGSILPCRKCNTLRALVIGFTTVPVVSAVACTPKTTP